MKIFFKAAAVLLLSFSAGACASAQVKAPAYPADGQDWPKAKAEKYGFDPNYTESLTAYLVDSTAATGVAVIVGGEQIFSFGDLSRLSYIASCRKSLLSMLYGKYVENGTINLSKTVEDLGFDDIGGLLPIEKQATVYDLITSRSGVYHPASNAGDSEDKPERGSKKPGEYFLYNNWDFNVAGAAFEKMTGLNIYDAFETDIALPIGMQDWDRSIQKKTGNLKVSCFPAYHFHLSVRDMARVGYLMLRKGNWNGRQLISEDWVSRMTTPVSPYSEVTGKSSVDRFSYGYMWWLFDAASPEYLPQYKGAYTARGAMGQYITVIPELDMVVAFKTDSVYQRSTTSAAYFRFLDKFIATHKSYKK